ncbi:cation efflux protein [Papiliotrema laurentii]|uniref:Cation efflux protein n=1 Tax=Papiliotrema laurentii TaxID=5418 RepID=A0AAD9CSH3_PAPLA|nr:cation efflux protein [Papiliotrema laurentii]
MFCIISAGIYKATGFKYADPIASFFVGCMIIGTVWSLIMRAGRSLLAAAPDSIDVKGVKEDVERITGAETVHDLHVWSITKRLSPRYICGM